MRRRGAARSPLPGIFVSADLEDSWELRLAAAHRWAPDLVVCGASAAKLLWWEDLQDETVWLSGRKRKSPARWLSVTQSKIPPEQIWHHNGMLVASPALSALQLALTKGSIAIDEALRRGVPLSDMAEALESYAGRKGNVLLRRLLWESRTEPWSPLERDAHQRLREAGITGWKANHRVDIGDKTYYNDISFPGLKLAAEIDGFEHHRSRSAFDNDRIKHNDLVLDGWTVLLFTSNTLDTLIPGIRTVMGWHRHR